MQHRTGKYRVGNRAPQAEGEYRIPGVPFTDKFEPRVTPAVYLLIYKRISAPQVRFFARVENSEYRIDGSVTPLAWSALLCLYICYSIKFHSSPNSLAGFRGSERDQANSTTTVRCIT